MTREQWIDESVERLDGWYAADSGSNGFDNEEKARIELAVANDVGKTLRAMTDKEAEILITWGDDMPQEIIQRAERTWPDVTRALNLIYGIGNESSG